MLNAQTKLSVIGALALLLTACSGKTDPNEAAQPLFEQAQSLLDAGRPADAITLLDSLDRAHASAVKVRREGMNLRARATEQLTLNQLAETDSLMVTLQARQAELSGKLQRVANAIEPYFIASGSSLAPTGIEARVAPDGVVYLVSSLSGHQVRHTTVTASAGGETAATHPVGNDGERSEWTAQNETVHFVGEECDSIVRFIAKQTTPVTITWSGRSSYSRPLTAGEQKAIATIGEYAATSTALKVAVTRHERLEKQLEVARSQTARTTADPAPAKE